MARAYHDGALGFLRSDKLARTWVLSAGLDDDPMSMLQLALDRFGHNDLADAWIWATNAEDHDGASDEAKRLAALIVKRVKELRPKGPTGEEHARIGLFGQGRIDRFRWRAERKQ